MALSEVITGLSPPPRPFLDPSGAPPVAYSSAPDVATAPTLLFLRGGISSLPGTSSERGDGPLPACTGDPVLRASA